MKNHGMDSVLGADESTVSNDGTLKVSNILMAVGFSLMLAWHYLVLFTPALTSDQGAELSSYLFSRQLVLYASLAVAFVVIGIAHSRTSKRGKQVHLSSGLICASGVFAVIASAVCAVVPVSNMPAFLGATALLGASEAVLMFFWLQMFVNRNADNLLASFALYMITGGVLALLTCYLQWPISAVAASLAPGLSMLALVRESKRLLAQNQELATPNGREDESGSASRSDEADREIIDAGDASTSANTAANEMAAESDAKSAGNANAASANANSIRYADRSYSTAGSGQASILATDKAGNSELDDEDPLAREREVHWSRYMALSISAYALAFGVVQGSFAVSNITMLMAENPLVLLGVALAGAVIYLIPSTFGRGISVDLMHRYSLLLFIIGTVVVTWFDYSEFFLVASQVAILAGFNLFDFGVMTHGMSGSRNDAQGVASVLRGGRPLVYICLAIGLFIGFLLVQGISEPNALRMLTIICGVAAIVLVATTLIPYYSFYEVSKESEEEGMPVELPNAYPHAEIAAINYLSGSASEKQELPEDWVSPWKSACTQIAKLYQLSPRETEIFFFLAKGRNADYVQQKLVISTHTAKTHIANIYRKLEVHSSQELLDLVEAFRDAERRLAESDDEPMP